MISKAFIDTNIILDIILERAPFVNNAQNVLIEVAERNITPYLSGSSITDLYYICRKSGLEKQKIIQYLKTLMDTFEIVIIDKNTILEAIASELKDFEDAVQVMGCKREGIDIIITRNKKDFSNAWCRVNTPEEFLAT